MLNIFRVNIIIAFYYGSVVKYKNSIDISAPNYYILFTLTERTETKERGEHIKSTKSQIQIAPNCRKFGFHFISLFKYILIVTYSYII